MIGPHSRIARMVRVTCLRFCARPARLRIRVRWSSDLTLNEKRAILASWASDASTKDGVTATRPLREGLLPVGFDDIMDALHELDEQAAHDNRPRPHYRRVLRRPRASGRS